MGCNCCHHSGCSPEKKKNKYIPAIISLVLLAAGMIMNHFQLFTLPYSALAWYTVAYLPVGWPVLKEAFEGLRHREFFNEFMLMSIATIGAFCIGEYPEGVAVMLFYSIGEAFQDRAVGSAQRNIKALLDVRPETATVIRDGKPEKVHPESVKVGETIEIKAGERVPLDGTMQSGQASFNTAALTGESRPRSIREGEMVLAGMIATDRVVRLLVGKPYNESALARILAMVQEANERKAPVELFIRRFAQVYTPIVTGLAVLIVLLPFLYSLGASGFDYVFKDWLYRSLVFLVISCPCALVVSIPLGYFGGIGAASRIGILFKGGNYLDAITQINTVVFDKTGTLTKGVFEVQHVESTLSSEAELLKYIASAEQKSTHPIAHAIGRYAKDKKIVLSAVSDTTEIPGHGLKVRIDGHEVWVGNPRLLSRYQISYPADLDASAETIVACAVDGAYAGYLLLSDTPKEDAATAVKELKALNIDNIQILSGDKQAIVSKLGAQLGVSQAYGDLLPEGKVAHIESLKANPAHRIAFVGDGINDAPVLAMSHVGIAMGGLGSDAAIETADVVIQNDQPSKVAAAIRIGRATRRIVWENIFLAFGVKLAVLLLGAIGIATMWEAVFADVGVALIAILNAIRIQKKKY
ncbi:heavy metal translocating P-type ATPase [Bacteroides sp.]